LEIEERFVGSSRPSGPGGSTGRRYGKTHRNVEYTVGYFGLGSILLAERSTAGYLGVTSLIIRGTPDYRVMGEPPLVVFAFHGRNILKMDEEMGGLKKSAERNKHKVE